MTLAVPQSLVQARDTALPSTRSRVISHEASISFGQDPDKAGEPSSTRLPHHRSSDPGESRSTRRLRLRTRKSYVLPSLNLSDDEINTEYPNTNITSLSIGGPSHQHESPKEPPATLPDTSKRLRISRDHQPSTPPPLLTEPVLGYIKPDAFPTWLLSNTMVKSSPVWLENLNANPASSPQRDPPHLAQTSIMGTSPYKPTNRLRATLQRPSSSTVPPSWSQEHLCSLPDEELERCRERFWAHYEYDQTAPHLQSKYFDQPFPADEQWEDLDIQDVGSVPEPKPGPCSNHLFDVYTPTPVSKVDRLVDKTRPDSPSPAEFEGCGFEFYVKWPIRETS